MSSESAESSVLASLREPIDQPCPDGSVAPLSQLLDDLSEYTELDLDTFSYHVSHSNNTAKNEHWHASINEARAFVEALIISIALVARRRTMAELREGIEGQVCYRLCRRYLSEEGFLSADDNVLLQHVLDITAVKGTHPGMTDAPWGRLGRAMLCATARYLVERYKSWRRLVLRFEPPAVPSSPPTQFAAPTP